MENSSQLKVSGLIAKADFIMILILGDPHSLHTDIAQSYEMNKQYCLHKLSEHGVHLCKLDLDPNILQYIGSCRTSLVKNNHLRGEKNQYVL